MRTPAALLLIAPFLGAQSPALPPPPEDFAQPPAQAERHPSGLISRIIRPGTGKDRPQDSSLAILHFTVWDAQGKAFGHSRLEAIPPHMLVTTMMPGMREGVKAMVPGEVRRLWIPEKLAFGGAPHRPKGTLVMEVELFEVQDHPTQAPADVAAPPSDALILPSGLAYKVLREGTGTQQPDKNSTVEVHYTGWTTDGKMFDSSLLRREPLTIKVRGAIKGWIEGLPLMRIGERRRYWVPQKLAYGGAQGYPPGTLVFDIELLGISK